MVDEGAVSSLNTTPVANLADGTVAIDATAAAATVEAVATGKDFPHLISYAYTRLRLCVITFYHVVLC